MNTMKKRIFSGILAIATAASMAVPTFAANESVITATYSEPTISVTVTDTAEAVINPYGLGVNVTIGGQKQVISGQITSKPVLIQNKSTMRLNVNATATVEVQAPTTSGATKMTILKSVTTTTKTKSAAVKLQVVAPASIKGTAEEVKATSDIVLNAYVKEATWEDAQTLQLDEAGPVTSKTAMAVLAPAKMGEDGAFASFDAGSVALVRLTGNVVTAPKTASGGDDPWTAEDSFITTVAFSFAPASEE